MIGKFRHHAQCGDPNGKDRCRWCGKKLRQKYDYHYRERTDGFVSLEIESKTPWKKKGDYGDGLFCGLRCGYSYGVDVAKKRRRRS